MSSKEYYGRDYINYSDGSYSYKQYNMNGTTTYKCRNGSRMTYDNSKKRYYNYEYRRNYYYNYY